MAQRASLYDHDFVLWSEQQADAIRHAAASGTNLPLDWENLAEEIESLGKSQRTEIASRTRTIVEHLLKLECSPALLPRAGWRATIRRTRSDLEDLLDESPSLRARLSDILDRVQASAADDTARALADAGEAAAAGEARLRAGGYTVEQVFGPWFPDGDPG